MNDQAAVDTPKYIRQVTVGDEVFIHSTEDVPNKFGAKPQMRNRERVVIWVKAVVTRTSNTSIWAKAEGKDKAVRYAKNTGYVWGGGYDYRISTRYQIEGDTPVEQRNAEARAVIAERVRENELLRDADEAVSSVAKARKEFAVRFELQAVIWLLERIKQRKEEFEVAKRKLQEALHSDDPYVNMDHAGVVNTLPREIWWLENQLRTLEEHGTIENEKHRERLVDGAMTDIGQMVRGITLHLEFPNELRYKVKLATLLGSKDFPFGVMA